MTWKFCWQSCFPISHVGHSTKTWRAKKELKLYFHKFPTEEAKALPTTRIWKVRWYVLKRKQPFRYLDWIRIPQSGSGRKGWTWSCQISSIQAGNHLILLFFHISLLCLFKNMLVLQIWSHRQIGGMDDEYYYYDDYSQEYYQDYPLYRLGSVPN